MTLRFGSIDYNVLYVDPSISAAGDGSLPTTPLTNLPVLASLVDKTCFIIRRTALTAACQHIYGTTSTISNLIFMGMPKTTEVASSWAILKEPASRIALSPCAPSLPIPVRMIPTALFPTCSATE